MLAKLGRPFDSGEHLFEIKWDGIRALAFVEEGGYRLVSRSRRPLAARYPELAFLAGLPDGTALDGELVALDETGRPDFPTVMTREQARGAPRIALLARRHPVSYVAFDVLFVAGRSVMGEPLLERRRLLEEICASSGQGRLVFSAGVVGGGKAFFAEARQRDLEGIVAKHVASPYEPGRRSGAWTKIKTFRRMHCAVIGYLEEQGDLKSLVVAAEIEGVLRCVGRVGTGFGERTRRELLAALRARPREAPLVEPGAAGSSGTVGSAGAEARWVEPGIYCTVSYLERTKAGSLRAPVFVDWFVDEG